MSFALLREAGQATAVVVQIVSDNVPGDPDKVEVRALEKLGVSVNQPGTFPYSTTQRVGFVGPRVLRVVARSALKYVLVLTVGKLRNGVLVYPGMRDVFWTEDPVPDMTMSRLYIDTHIMAMHASKVHLIGMIDLMLRRPMGVGVFRLHENRGINVPYSFFVQVQQALSGPFTTTYTSVGNRRRVFPHFQYLSTANTRQEQKHIITTNMEALAAFLHPFCFVSPALRSSLDAIAGARMHGLVTLHAKARFHLCYTQLDYSYLGNLRIVEAYALPFVFQPSLGGWDFLAPVGLNGKGSGDWLPVIAQSKKSVCGRDDREWARKAGAARGR